MNNALILNPPISIKGLSLKLNLRVFWILTSILVTSLLSLYIFQVNTVIKNSYLIKNCEKALSVLSQENNVLKINLSQSNSLDDIEKQVMNLNFEKIGEVKYIQILGSEVATK
jgi:hypothetical protein